jgi:hypothetical protein
MKIMVTCGDDRRRVAEVEKWSLEDCFSGTVRMASNGKIVQGMVVPGANLEFKFVAYPALLFKELVP